MGRADELAVEGGEVVIGPVLLVGGEVGREQVLEVGDELGRAPAVHAAERAERSLEQLADDADQPWRCRCRQASAPAAPHECRSGSPGVRAGLHVPASGPASTRRSVPAPCVRRVGAGSGNLPRRFIPYSDASTEYCAWVSPSGATARSTAARHFIDSRHTRGSPASATRCSLALQYMTTVSMATIAWCERHLARARRVMNCS